MKTAMKISCWAAVSLSEVFVFCRETKHMCGTVGESNEPHLLIVSVLV